MATLHPSRTNDVYSTRIQDSAQCEMMIIYHSANWLLRLSRVFPIAFGAAFKAQRRARWGLRSRVRATLTAERQGKEFDVRANGPDGIAYTPAWVRQLLNCFYLHLQEKHGVPARQRRYARSHLTSHYLLVIQKHFVISICQIPQVKLTERFFFSSCIFSSDIEREAPLLFSASVALPFAYDLITNDIWKQARGRNSNIDRILSQHGSAIAFA